jgi:hypothetical protein
MLDPVSLSAEVEASLLNDPRVRCRFWTGVNRLSAQDFGTQFRLAYMARGPVATSARPGATAERPGVSNDWFAMLYRVLLGESRGPRFGSFVALYGIEETRALIANAMSGELMRAQAARDAQR